MTHVCPHCGQRMLVRHGVKLPPLLADLFDSIERMPKDVETLAWVFYGGKSKRDGGNCVKANIWRLNDLLEPTTVKIDFTEGRYEVVGRMVAEVA